MRIRTLRDLKNYIDVVADYYLDLPVEVEDTLGDSCEIEDIKLQYVDEDENKLDRPYFKLELDYWKSE